MTSTGSPLLRVVASRRRLGSPGVFSARSGNAGVSPRPPPVFLACGAVRTRVDFCALARGSGRGRACVPDSGNHCGCGSPVRAQPRDHGSTFCRSRARPSGHGGVRTVPGQRHVHIDGDVGRTNDCGTHGAVSLSSARRGDVPDRAASSRSCRADLPYRCSALDCVFRVPPPLVLPTAAWGPAAFCPRIYS